MSLRKSVEESNGSKEDINFLNPQEQDKHSDEAEMFAKNSDSGDSSEFSLVDEDISDNENLEPEEITTESVASEVNLKCSDSEKDESIQENKSPATFSDDLEAKKLEDLLIEDQYKEFIPETESSILIKSEDSERMGQNIDQSEEKDNISSGKDNTLQMLVKPQNELEEAGKFNKVEMSEFDESSEGESTEFILVDEVTCENGNLEHGETRTESDASEVNVESSDLEKDEWIKENKSPATFSDDLEETKKWEDLSSTDQHKEFIPEILSSILTKSEYPEQVVQNIDQCEEKDNTLIGNSNTSQMLVNVLENVLEETGKSSALPDDNEHIDKDLLYDVKKLDDFLDQYEKLDITSQHQDETAEETNSELQKCVMSHLTMPAKSLQSSDTEKTLLEVAMEGIDSSEANDQSRCHLNSEWHRSTNRDLSKETAFREKRHLFIKITVLLDEYDTYFKITCSFLSTDPNIMNSLVFINKLVCTDCRLSSNPCVLLRSLGLIQALLLNPNCELDIQQLYSFIEFLMFCLLTNPSSSIQDDFSHMIGLLVAEITKGQDPIHKALYLGVIDFTERIILQEPNLDFRICCSLMDSVVSMGFVAVCLLMPKIFPKMRKMVGASLDVLNLTKEDDATRQHFATQNSIKEFNRKMLDISNALELHGKLLDACELLMKSFFLENFTHSAVSNLLKSRQSSFSDNNSCLLKLQYKQLEPFFKDCLEYFGEALTARLSLICTQYNCAKYLEQLFEDTLMYTFNNTFMNCNLLLRTWKNRERKRREKENTFKPPFTKGQWLLDSHQIKTMFGESRCGFIHASSNAAVFERNECEASQNSCNVMKPAEGSKIKHPKELSESKLKAAPSVLKGESNRVLGEKPKVLRIPIKDLLRNRHSDKNVHKPVSSGLSNNVVDQMDISDDLTSCGSLAMDTSPVENVLPLPKDLGSCSVRTKHQQYLQTLKTPPNVSTLWLDKLCAKYSEGHKVKPMNWKSAEVSIKKYSKQLWEDKPIRINV